MGKSTSGSSVGTGGMAAKIAAAMIAANSGVDMVITNASRLENIIDILHGEEIGTLFLKHKNENFRLQEFI
jgi:glutamate 5-kinase